MSAARAWGAAGLMVAGTVAAFAAQWPLVVAMALVAIAAAASGRRMILAFAAVALPVNALASILALDAPWPEAAARGLVGGVRLVGGLAVNLAVLSRVPVPVLLDGLALPLGVRTLLAAVLLAARDIGRDFARLRDARRLEGEWPAGRLAAAGAAASLLPSLVVSAGARSSERADALRLAGHDTPDWFVPVVTVAALAAAGRLAFLALPNVALTFVVAFLGGMLLGAGRGAAGAALGMALTDLMLTGLHPLGFVNVAPMALVALLGAALRGVDFAGGSRADRIAGVIFAFVAGVAATLVFSVLTDTLTWLVVAPDSPGTWRVLVLAGLVFNVLPALGNGALFAGSVTPVARAFRALQEGGRGSPAPPEAALPAVLPAS